MASRTDLLFLMSLGALSQGCDDGSALPPCNPERLGRECNEPEDPTGQLPPWADPADSGGGNETEDGDGPDSGGSDTAPDSGPNSGGSDTAGYGTTSGGYGSTGYGYDTTGSGYSDTTGYYDTTGYGSSSGGYYDAVPDPDAPHARLEATACLSLADCAALHPENER